MTWASLPRAARAYVVAVILLGAALLASVLAVCPPQINGVQRAVMLLAAAVASQKLTLVGRPGAGRSHAHQMSTMSLAFPVVFGSVLHFGTGAGILVALASALGAGLYPRRHPVYRIAFTAANLGLAALASGTAMQMLLTSGVGLERAGGIQGLPSVEVPLSGLLVGTLTYYVVNTAMVAVAVALSQGERPLGLWRDHFLWTWPGFIAGGAMVRMTMALVAQFGNAVAWLSLLCLYLVYYSYSIYLQKMHQLQDNQCALRRAHDALEGRVRKRTAELAQSNELLKNEIAERKRAQEVKQQLLRRLVVVQEEERRRVARELHDQTGQYLTALMLGLEALREPERSPLGNQVGVARVQELTMELMQETHRLARRLRPAVLDDLGLHGALCHHLEEWSQYAGVSVDFHSPDFDTQRLPPDFETTLYRVVQEALTNVLRHAQAARVSVLLERRGSHVLLIVEDDGAGFDVKAVVDAPDARGRLGLIGMQERVEMLGGDLEIESATGAGTTVFVRIPISPENPCLSGKSLEGSVL